MSATIHRLTDAGPITEPVVSVIEMLEELLTRAKAGEIKGFGYFLVDGADTSATAWASGIACGNDMVAGAAKLQHRVLDAVLE